MQYPKALIFDVDGTLADTERDGHRVAFNLAFKNAGLDWHWDVETYGRLLEITGGKERIRYFIDEYRIPLNTPRNLDAFIRRLHQAKTRHFVSLLKTASIPLRPGVARLLNEARAAGLRLAIATTTTPENVTTLLTATLGVESIEWFDVIAAGDVVPNKKPAPDVYLYALAQLKLTAAECIAFEDSKNGLLSSLQAGLKTVVTVNAYTREQEMADAVIVLDQLGEPGESFNVLAGDAGGASFVNVPMISSFIDPSNTRMS